MSLENIIIKSELFENLINGNSFEAADDSSGAHESNIELKKAKKIIKDLKKNVKLLNQENIELKESKENSENDYRKLVEINQNFISNMEEQVEKLQEELNRSENKLSIEKNKNKKLDEKLKQIQSNFKTEKEELTSKLNKRIENLQSLFKSERKQFLNKIKELEEILDKSNPTQVLILILVKL